jgi:uncharacterized membrane protein
MKTFFAVTAVTLAVALTGCTQEDEKGGPGATAEKDANTDADDDRTFTLNVPDITTTVEQGGRDKASISISRGDEFKEEVKLQFKPPEGVTVTPADAAFNPDAEKVEITIEASAEAAPGDTNIEVTAVPQTGKSITKTMPITVTKP